MFFLNTLKKVAKVIHDHAYDELYAPEKIKTSLTQLQLDFELGKISQQEFEQREEELLIRLQDSYRDQANE